MLDSRLVAGPLDFGDELLEFLQIVCTYPAWLGDDLTLALKPHELPHSTEGKLDFVWVHDVPQDHVVPSIAKVIEPFDKLLRVVEKIRKEHYESPSVHPMCEVMEHGAHIRSRHRRDFFEFR